MPPIGLQFGLGAIARAVATLFNPNSLFANGEPGAWYDPSDLTTLFQDAAGTTPVTAVEQPVGLMLDKSGRGNHAFQSTSANRPVLSARVNLLTKTEQFADAAWTKTAATAPSTSAISAPFGAGAVNLLTEDSTNAFHQLYQATTTNGSNTFSVYLKPAGRTWVVLYGLMLGKDAGAWFNLSGAGSVGTRQADNLDATITLTSSGWYYCTIKFNGAQNGSMAVGLATSDNTTTYQGNGTSGVYIWGADLRVANDGVGLPPYQRVNTSTDYDTVGFPLYLKTDGVDDGMVTNSIDFTGTDKMTVWAGVRKLSDASSGQVIELSSIPDSNPGSFYFAAPNHAAANFGFKLVGTSAGQYLPSSSAAPTTVIASVAYNIGGSALAEEMVPRLNGVVSQSGGSGTAGTGTFGNYPLYLFRRGGTTLPFNGRCYGAIIRGAQSSASEIASTEAWLNQKTGAYEGTPGSLSLDLNFTANTYYSRVI